MWTERSLLITAPTIVDHDEDCIAAQAIIFNQQPEHELENDCVASGQLTTSQIRDKRSVFVRAANVHVVELAHGFHLALSPYAPAGPVVLNPVAWQRWHSFVSPKPLTQPIDHVLAEQFLIHPPGTSPKPTATQPDTLTVWLHVTNACSLDCPYCYVRKSSARMSEETGLQAVEAVFRTAQRHGFKRLKLKYAGGEATLHFRLVHRLHEYASRLANQTRLELKEVMLSNGIHLRATDAQWLKDNQVKLMISLDGIGEMYNRLRPLKNRPPSDTFSLVEHTIDHVLLPHGIRPDITMTITGINAGGAADVAKWALIDRGLPTSFNLYRQNLLSASRTDLTFEEQTILDGMLSAYDVIEEHLPTEPFLNGLLDRVQDKAHARTCGVGQSYVVITHTGQLAQCQMHLDFPVNHTLDGDLLTMVANGPIQNLPVDEKVGCRECTFRYRCSGGCPLETYRVTGRWDVQSPNCRIYKALYPAALRLEGLRLMKIHGYLT